MWKKLIAFNANITYRGGWCLEAVQKGYNSLHWYATALDQWRAEQNQHFDRPPLGIDVPVYFSIEGNAAGHIAVHQENGKVASASYAGTNYPMAIHDGIDGLIRDYAAGGVKLNYLGWGEHCANLRVTEYQEKENKVMVSERALEVLYRFYFGMPITDYGRKTYLGKVTFEEAQNRLSNSDEYKKLVNTIKTTQGGASSHLPKAIREVIKLPEQL